MKTGKKDESILKAVALRYNTAEDGAPKVVAKGMRRIAEQIIAIARENNIPVRDEPDLVELLMKVEIDEEIPEDLYLVVAEILAFIYRANRKWDAHSGLRPEAG